MKSTKGVKRALAKDNPGTSPLYVAHNHDHDEDVDHFECLIKIDSWIFKLWEVTYLIIIVTMLAMVVYSITTLYLLQLALVDIEIGQLNIPILDFYKTMWFL